MKTQLLLNEMKFFAHHGVLDEEKIIGGNYSVSLEIDADVSEAAKHDDLSQTIDFQSIYNIVKKEMQQPSQLIEHVAYRIATALKANFPQIEQIKVEVHKLNPPIGGEMKDEAIKILV